MMPELVIRSSKPPPLGEHFSPARLVRTVWGNRELIRNFAARHWQIVLLPVVVLPLALLTLGVTWLVSALGVFIRDVRHIVIVCTQLLMFMTPLFYRLDQRLAEHPVLRAVIEWNPLSVIIE